jgi:hypothetical protein
MVNCIRDLTAELALGALDLNRGALEADLDTGRNLNRMFTYS